MTNGSLMKVESIAECLQNAPGHSAILLICLGDNNFEIHYLSFGVWPFYAGFNLLYFELFFCLEKNLQDLRQSPIPSAQIRESWIRLTFT